MLGSGPQYVAFKEQIRTEMFTVKQKMNELKQLHGRAALTSFDDTKSSEMDIEVTTQDITRLFRKCEAQLQQFGHNASASEVDDKVGHLLYVLGAQQSTNVITCLVASTCSCMCVCMPLRLHAPTMSHVGSASWLQRALDCPCRAALCGALMSR